MGNCLVTKLKGSVDAEGLPVFGALNFKVNAGNNVARINIAGNKKVTVTGDCYITDVDGTQNLGKTGTVNGLMYFKGNGYVSVEDKYSIGNLTIVTEYISGDINEIAYINGGDNLYLSSGNLGANHADFYGDVTNIVFNWKTLFFSGNSKLTGNLKKTIDSKAKDIVEISTYGTSIELDLAWLRNTTNLKAFAAGSKAYGDFAALGHTKLSDVYFVPASAKIVTGTIEQFVANKIASGQTSGTFNLKWPGTFLNVTYKGTPLPNNNDVTDQTGNCTFTWDSAGNITWGSK